MTQKRGNSPETPPDMGQRAHWMCLAAVVAVAAWLRFGGLTDRELWFDESCTFYVVHNLLDWPADGPDALREVAHLPYYFLVRLWTQIAGETAFALRSFSALVGCATVLAVGGVASRFGGRWVGVIAAALAAVHPLHIYYSQEARVYSLWVLEALATLYVLFMAARMLKAHWWALYAMIAGLTVLTHYYTLFWLPGTIACAMIAPDRRRCLRQWAITHFCLALALVPAVWLLIIPLAEGGPRQWLSQTWAGYPPLLAIPQSMWALLSSGGYPPYLGPLAVAGESVSRELGALAGVAVLWGPTAVAALLFLVACARVERSDEGCPRENEDGRPNSAETPLPCRRVLIFLLAVTLAFLITAWCYSWLVTPGYVVGRYDFAAWPAVVIGTALAVEAALRRSPARSRRRGIMHGVSVAILIGCSVLTLLGVRAVPSSNDLTERARRVASVVGKADLVISLDMYRWFMTYPWHQLGFNARVVSFPSAHDRQLCWDDAQAELSDPARLSADLDSLFEQIDRTFAEGGRVWVLAHGEPTGPRWEVDRRFFARLGETGIALTLQDEWVGLAELLPSNAEPGNATEDDE